MSEFSNSFFRDLPPRDRRYDVPVADQLVFCVFPNGVKTWVHVYPFEEFTRRRTIGLYPDMRFEQVHDALSASRKIVELDSSHEQRRIQDIRRSRGLRNISMTVVAAAAGVAVSVLVARSLQGEVVATLPPLSAPSIVTSAPDPAPEPVSIHHDDPVVPHEDPIQLPETATVQTGQDLVDVQIDKPETVDEAGSPDETLAMIVHPDPAITLETDLTDPVTAQAEQDLVIAQVTTPETGIEEASVVEPDEVVPGDSGDTGKPGDDDAGTSGDPQTPVSAAEADPEQASKPETIVTPDTQPASEKVRRALLTDGISAHEPANVLKGPIGIDAENIRTVFFFTELTGLGGERISHHWKHLGSTIAEVPFDVRADGRWRVYSSKRISADQSGSWTVEVVTSDGVVLSTVAFEVETDPAN